MGLDTVMLIGGGIVLAAAIYYAASGKGTVVKAMDSFVHPVAATSDLATTMAALDERAKDQAYQAVSEQLVKHRAEKHLTELLEALAPKGQADGQ